MEDPEFLAKAAKEAKDAKTIFVLEEDRIAREIVDAAYTLYRDLGPGLYENVYEVLLADELRVRELTVECQAPIGLSYAGRSIDVAYRADLIVGGRVLVELKSVDVLQRAHRAQVVTYLRLADLRLGLLINFGSGSFQGAVKRIANGMPE
jgi:GxxExxY protein